MPSQSSIPRKRPGLCHRWLCICTGLYLFLVILAASLARQIAERHWACTMLLYLPQAMYLAPLPLFALAAWWRRDRPAGMLVILSCLVIAGPIMGLQTPTWPKKSERPTVRVLSYNLHRDREGWDNARREFEAFPADVVVLSEAQETRERPAFQHYFRDWHLAHAGDVTIGSRWPILEQHADLLEPSVDLRKYQPRYKLRVALQSPLGRLHVVGVHFHTGSPGGPSLRRPQSHFREGAGVRLRTAEALTRWLADVNEPMIVAGDFNTPPRGRVYGELTRQYRDAFAEAGFGWGHTFPARWPLLRIDYIFHSRHWETAWCRTGGANGSDHRPVLAELSLAGGRGQTVSESDSVSPPNR